MPDALTPAGLSSQTHQGVTARVLHRFGRSVRGVIAGGIALTGRRRRSAAAPPGSNPAEPQDAAALPSPGRKRAPRRPHAATPAPSPRPGWLARWFGPKRRRPARFAPPFPDSDDTPFTPETHPGLSPEACAFFNTPVEDCDPDLLRLMLAALAGHIAGSLPPELGMDAEALFATLCGRFGAVPDEAGPDAQPAEGPPAEPAAAKDAEPDAPPEPPLQAPATEPVGGAALATTADADSPAAFVLPRFRPSFDDSRSFRRRRRSRVDRGRPRLQRGRRDGQQHPPARLLCYAACAGPP